jgi:hypothetical protein
MAQELLPKYSTHNSHGSVPVPEPVPAQEPPCGAAPHKRLTSCTPLFKTWITLHDGAGGKWRVQYDGWQFKGRVKEQRHFRLTCGWKNFIKDKNVQIGKPRPNLALEHGRGGAWGLYVLHRWI